MGKAPCCSKVGIHKGPWTAREDSLLASYIQTHGEGNWRSLPKKAGLLRCGKSCRLRWMNYLRPDIKRGNIGPEEEDLIIRLHRLLGNRWSLIAGRLPGRTDNEIKNYWNSHLSKKLRKEGFLLRSEATPPRTTKQSKASSSHKKQSMNHEICAPKPTRLAAATIHVMEKSEEDQMKAAGASSSDESSGSDGRINEMELHSDNYWSDAGDFDRCLIDPNLQYLDLGRRCEPQFLSLQEDDVMNFEKLYDEYSQLWQSEVDLNQMFDHDHHHSLTNLLHPQLHAHA